MPKIARLIIYDASEEVLTKQLSKSLSEGMHDKGHIKITVVTLSSEKQFVDKISHDLENIFTILFNFG